ncbi:MAG: DUF2155 domain-containing protein [bacterium]
MIRFGLPVVLLMMAQMASADIVEARGGELRFLDKMTGVVSDHDLSIGQSQVQGKLTVTLDDCRYPSDQPTGEAYAHLTIMDQASADPVFKGWMIASSPALNALDHARYDVWVLRCDVPATADGSNG